MWEEISIDEATLKKLRRAWQEEQSRLWQAFTGSLSPEQQKLLYKYRRATAILGRLDKWEWRLSRRLPLRGKPIGFPNELD